ncbi:MAG: hypothetical protein AAFZ09_09020 [Pseudomonadota bacterium]
MSDITDPAYDPVDLGLPDDETDLRPGMSVDFAIVCAALARIGIAAPPEGIEWPAEWLVLGPALFATWRPTVAPYDLAGLMAEALSLPEGEAALLGMDGHGTNSYAMHAVLKRHCVLMGFQTAAGGVLMSEQAGMRRIDATWRILADIVGHARRLAEDGKVPHDRMLVAIDSDIAPSRWAWVEAAGSAEAVDWQDTRFAAFAARTALEGL